MEYGGGIMGWSREGASLWKHGLETRSNMWVGDGKDEKQPSLVACGWGGGGSVYD